MNSERMAALRRRVDDAMARAADGCDGDDGNPNYVRQQLGRAADLILTYLEELRRDDRFQTARKASVHGKGVAE